MIEEKDYLVEELELVSKEDLHELYTITRKKNLELQEELDLYIKLIKSDSVRILLRYGVKNPDRSGINECEDSDYFDLYYLSRS